MKTRLSSIETKDLFNWYARNQINSLFHEQPGVPAVLYRSVPLQERGDQASDFIYSGIPQTAHLLQHTSGLMGEASRGAAGRRAEALLGRILVSSFATALYLNPKGLSDVVPNHS